MRTYRRLCPPHTQQKMESITVTGARHVPGHRPGEREGGEKLKCSTCTPDLLHFLFLNVVVNVHLCQGNPLYGYSESTVSDAGSQFDRSHNKS